MRTCRGSPDTLFLAFTAIMLIDALFVVVLGEQTNGPTLEQIAGA
ncbi:MAG TPA: hypothetical protein VEQ11_15770 [Chloroflexota bacterium]|nr:hypothetical protein [Chloroflexota bacterium]